MKTFLSAMIGLPLVPVFLLGYMYEYIKTGFNNGRIYYQEQFLK